MNAPAATLTRDDVAGILGALRGRGIHLEVEAGKIILEPADLVTEADLETLREVKQIALELLRSEQPPPRPIHTSNAARTPLCSTTGCPRRDTPMLRTISRVPSWICPSCWAICRTVTGDPAA